MPLCGVVKGRAMDDIIARMDVEEAVLVRRLEAVRAVKLAYGITPATSITDAPRPSFAHGTPRLVRMSVPRTADDRKDKFGAYGQSVIEAALTAIMPGDLAPTPTRELVKMIEELGVPIRGENKVNALTALLARSSKFKGHGRAGWTVQTDEIAPSGAEENGHPGTRSPGEPDTGKEGVDASSEPPSTPNPQ